mmetsp:Transcript_80748/g.261773  ORF Transcript_80748/g.261773 Transcript_80748/m.261773 type:complete len:273 (-) Transcript_80748:3679-4497(-)
MCQLRAVDEQPVPASRPPTLRDRRGGAGATRYTGSTGDLVRCRQRHTRAQRDDRKLELPSFLGLAVGPWGCNWHSKGPKLESTDEGLPSCSHTMKGQKELGHLLAHPEHRSCKQAEHRLDGGDTHRLDVRELSLEKVLERAQHSLGSLGLNAAAPPHLERRALPQFLVEMLRIAPDAIDLDDLVAFNSEGIWIPAAELGPYGFIDDLDDQGSTRLADTQRSELLTWVPAQHDFVLDCQRGLAVPRQQEIRNAHAFGKARPASGPLLRWLQNI